MTKDDLTVVEGGGGTAGEDLCQRMLEDGAKEFEELISLSEKIDTPHLFFLLKPEGALCYENCVSQNDYDSIRRICAMAVILAYGVIGEQDGRDAADAYLARVVADAVKTGES